ncbi:MAG TPA: 2Fe-2S iron-sulfur cluster-binding protein [Xenococcaceae cyanobacterium]
MVEATKSTTKTTCTLKVWDGKDWHELEVKRGAILRQVLQENNLSPHDSITRYVNCHGKGVCALCSVRLDGAAPEPQQWLDHVTAKFGWRLSCKVPVDCDLTVKLV